MLNFVQGCSHLFGQSIKPVPDDEGNANMVALFAAFPGLALGYPSQLLKFAMKLLDVPTKPTNLFGSLRCLEAYLVG